MLTRFFWLLVGHALCDYPLQGDFIGRFKNRHIAKTGFQGNVPVPWWHLMTAHAVIHAGAVALVTGSWVLGSVEFAAHWIIDFAKCEGWTGIHTDQGLHVACKLVFVICLGTP